jgi:hypothetical protein
MAVLTCPPGQSLIAGVCKPTGACPPGKVWDGTRCIIANFPGGPDAGDPINQPGTTPPPVPNCPAGQHNEPDGRGGFRCVPNVAAPTKRCTAHGYRTGPNGECIDDPAWGCPPGSTKKPASAGGGCTDIVGQAGGGAPAGGGGGAARITAPPAAPYAGIEKEIWDQISALMGGELSAFGPDAMRAMRNRAQMTAMGRGRAERDALTELMVNNGMLRSGMAARGFADIERGVSGEIGSRFGELDIAKAQSDVQLKLRGLDLATQFLREREQYLLGKESNAITREIGLAQVKLGYAKINAERDMLSQQLAFQDRSFNFNGQDIPVWLLPLLLGG